MNSHLFCNSVGVYIVCVCKLNEPDVSTLMPKHVTHNLQVEFISQEAVPDLELSLSSDHNVTSMNLML